MEVKSIFKYALFTGSMFLFVLLNSCDSTGTDGDDHNDGEHVNNTRFSATADFSYTIPVGGKEALSLRAVSGSINISTRGDLNEARVWGERRVESDSRPDAEEHLEYLSVEVSETNDQLRVETYQPGSSKGRNYIVHYNLEIPVTWETDLNHINGDIDLDSLQGPVYITLINGDIRLKGINGNCDVDLTNGRIDADLTIPIKGWCRLSNINGQVDLTIPKNTSARFSASAVNGTISVAGLSMQDVVSSRGSYCCKFGEGEGTIDIDVINGIVRVSGK